MPAIDNAANLGTQPAYDGAVVAPSDTVDLVNTTRAIWVGGAGNLAVDFKGGETNVLISGILAGTILPLRVNRIRATNTTATMIVALW